MRRYGLRIWAANALIVGSLCVISIVFLPRIIPEAYQPSESLLQDIALIVSLFTLLCSIFEAVSLYRCWKVDVKKESENTSETPIE